MDAFVALGSTSNFRQAWQTEKYCGLKAIADTTLEQQLTIISINYSVKRFLSQSSCLVHKMVMDISNI